MSKIPLISIIIPVYNAEKYLRNCIDSIINQDYLNYELIIIDDGSTDASPDICDEYEEKYSKIRVLHKENGGVLAARKDAVNLSKGKYIVCVDSDDWIDQNCLSSIANVIKKTDAEIVCFGYVFVGEKSSVLNQLNERMGFYHSDEIEKEIFPHLILSKNARNFAPMLWGKAIKRELLINNMLSNSMVTLGEDGACVIPCIYHAKTMYIMKECLYYYRYNQNSATKRKKASNWKWPLIVANHIKSKIDINYCDFKEQLNRIIVFNLFEIIVTQFYREDSYRTIVTDIKKNLNIKEYKEAIEKSCFEKSIKAKLKKFTMKHNIFFIAYLYSKLKN